MNLHVAVGGGTIRHLLWRILIWWQGRKCVRSTKRRLMRSAQSAHSSLSCVARVSVGVSHRVFVANEHLVVGTHADTGITLITVGKECERRFAGVEERPHGELVLVAYDLPVGRVAHCTMSLSSSKTRSGLAVAFALMKVQQAGQRGVLLTNGSCNIFLVPDAQRTIRPFFVFWKDGGWNVATGSFADPFLRFGPYRVFLADRQRY